MPALPGRRMRVVALLAVALLAVVLLAVVLLAGGVLGLQVASAPTTAPARPVAASEPVPRPTAAVVGATGDQVPWQHPLALRVDDGTLTRATVTDDTGASVAGTATTATWHSAASLTPATTYRVTLTVRDQAARLHHIGLLARTPAAERVVTASLSPGDDALVGVGKAVAVLLSRDVEGKAARRALTARLSVTTTPAVAGAWRWMDARTVHYRPAQLWRPGTEVSVRADLARLPLPDGTWGSGVRTTRFRIGDALVSTVDVGAKTMTVRRNGTVVRTMRASMGRPEFPTRNGTFVVLEKHRRKIMDSATLNLPAGTPAYRLGVDHAVRISNSGTFTHSAPWSVRDQGVRNVSHGCINLSPADAAWFYEHATRGDVVQVVGSSEGPIPWDPGSRDWNMTWEEWTSRALG